MPEARPLSGYDVFAFTRRDVEGRRVRVLEDGELSAGPHTKMWNGTDGDGRLLSSGAYFVELEAEGKRLVKRMAWTR